MSFDDNSANQIVSLVGSLDPSLVNESSGLSYTLVGSGTIFGPGSLVMNGSGTLTISNANSYTGGTVINNGDVDIKNTAQQALGVGPVTLAGGKLEIGIASGVATAGVSNLNVTANSTLQVDATGTYAFNVLNSLNGLSTATLTINNGAAYSSTASRICLYGVFTNNSAINFAVNGDGNELDFAPYNDTGSQVYNGLISGTGGRINVRAAGTVILTNANTFNDSGVTANGGGPSGYSVFISGGNLGLGGDSSPDFSAVSPGAGSSPAGTGILGINSGPSEGGNASLFAYGGAHTIANPIIYTTANTNYVLTISGSNNLTLSGQFNLNGADNTGNTNRTIQVNNTALTTLSGVVSDGGYNCGIIKSGNGALYLDGINSYAGSSTVSNGMLAGIGTIVGPVVVASTGTISGGDSAAIGTLTINNNLTLGGNAWFKVNTNAAPANDRILVSGVLTNTGAGTLTVTNLGPALAVGMRFVLFSEAVSNGAAMTVTGAGMTWTNHLALDGSITTLSVASSVSTNAFTITNSYAGGILKLSWPLNHIGFVLQSQTNTLATGLGTNWVNVSSVGSVNPSQTNLVNILVDVTKGTVFYRLVYP